MYIVYPGYNNGTHRRNNTSLSRSFNYLLTVLSLWRANRWGQTLGIKFSFFWKIQYNNTLFQNLEGTYIHNAHIPVPFTIKDEKKYYRNNLLLENKHLL